MLFHCERSFDTTVRDQPDQGRDQEDALGNPGDTKSDNDGDDVQEGRQPAFPIAADRFFQDGVLILNTNDGLLEEIVGNGRHEQHARVQGGGHSGELVLAHPAGGEGKE